MFENVKCFNFIEKCEESLKDIYKNIESTALNNQEKILEAMRNNSLAERHFAPSSGYGYSDEGREVCEKIYAEIFGAEKAIVRPQIVSGTHAIMLCLFAVLRPGDNFISVTGKPYDTIYSNIGLNEKNQGMGTLADYNISYKELNLNEKNEPDIDALYESIDENTKLVYIQRSTGYSLREALTIDKIEGVITAVKQKRADIAVLIDNCYGEFLESKEPCEIGADLIAGSLIKNPGGGLAQTGGYICGKSSFVDMAAARLSAPSIAYEVGANMGVIRSYLQGLFLAPSTVSYALKGAVLTAKVFEELEYKVFPKPDSKRSDIIQAIEFGNSDDVVAYCNAIQKTSPVDSYVTCEAWDMPGYDDKIIMAAGNFIQGSSIELSADSPIKPPYVVYQQGGLTYEHVKIAIYNALISLKKF